MFVTRNVRLKYQAPAGDETGSDNGGTGSSGTTLPEGAGQETLEGLTEGVVAPKDERKGEGELPAPNKPSDAEARLLKENMQKKEQLRKAQAELDDFRKKFSGIDPDQVRQMLAERKNEEIKQLEAKGDYERLRARMAEEHQKEISTMAERLQAAENERHQLQNVIKELSVGGEFGKSKFISEELTLTPSKARMIYGEYFDVGDGGVVIGFDKPRGAENRTALVDQYGTPVPFDEAMRKLVEADPEKDYLLKAKMKAGSGSETRTTKPTPVKDKFETNVSKIAAGLKGLKVSG